MQQRWYGSLGQFTRLALIVSSLALVPSGYAVAQAPSAPSASPGFPGVVAVGDEMAPRLSVGPRGEVFRLWQRTADPRAGGGAVVIAIARPKDAWETLLDLRPSEKGVSTQEGDLAVASSGELAVAYQWWRDTPRAKQVRVAWSEGVGKPWTRVDTPMNSANKGFEPRIAWAKDKSLVVVWSDERRGGRLFDIYSRRSPDGGKTWEPEQLLSRFGRNFPGDLHARPRLLSDGKDRLWTVWVGVRSRRSSIYMNRSTDGGKTWTEPMELTGESRSVFGHSLQRAGDRLLLVWHDTRTGRDRMYSAASSDAGATWTAPARVDHLPDEQASPQVVDATSPAVLFAGDGRALVAWQDMRNSREDIFLASSSDGGRTWGASDQRMDADEPGTAISRYPKLTLAPDGRVALAWEDDRAGHEGIYLRVRSEGSNPQWGPEILVVPPGQKSGARVPELAWVPDGLYIAWESWDYTAGPSRIVKTIGARVMTLDGR